MAKRELIPEEYAFCMQADEGHIAMARNRNPRIAWSGAPAGAKSLAIICHDPDVPSKPDNVNKEGVTVPASLPRVDFYHWVLVDVPVDRHEILAGEDSHGITAGGKPLGRTEYGVRGLNNYTDWFASDPDMKGDYGGYDGPCPPWNDEIVHHYHFTVYALMSRRSGFRVGSAGRKRSKRCKAISSTRPAGSASTASTRWFIRAEAR